jgi:hypothetical protein
MSKKQPKLTDWFPARTEPARRGEYEVNRHRVNAVYPSQTKLYWDGNDWRHTVESANGHFPGSFADMSGKDTWRGLAVKP